MVVLRIEDLDGPRIKAEATNQTIDILQWLGLDWDGPILTQSDDLSAYESAMEYLASRGLVYQCDLTRRQIEAAASAPHESTGERRYPPEWRPADPTRYRFDRTQTNYRLTVDAGSLVIHDEVLGPVAVDPGREVGDFVVWTKRGTPSYQLAVVVDDIRQGVTQVVRGQDLLTSAGRQALLYRAFEAPQPRWWHLPLVLGPDGRRLAKRHGDSRLATYRHAGVPAERVIALIAKWSGIPDAGDTLSASEFACQFDQDTLPTDPVVMTEEDHLWLLAAAQR